MRQINVIKYIILAILVVGIALYFLSPKVEDVQFTENTNRFHNNLWITVNTKEGLFTGRESFFSFKRDHYSISMKIKGKEYTERDMEVTIYGKTEMTIEPKRGIVKITSDGPNRISIIVDISDDRIPKLINGNYILRLADSGSNHRWYRMK